MQCVVVGQPMASIPAISELSGPCQRHVAPPSVDTRTLHPWIPSSTRLKQRFTEGHVMYCCSCSGWRCGACARTRPEDAVGFGLDAQVTPAFVDDAPSPSKFTSRPPTW